MPKSQAVDSTKSTLRVFYDPQEIALISHTCIDSTVSANDNYHKAGDNSFMVTCHNTIITAINQSISIVVKSIVRSYVKW